MHFFLRLAELDESARQKNFLLRGVRPCPFDGRLETCGTGVMGVIEDANAFLLTELKCFSAVDSF